MHTKCNVASIEKSIAFDPRPDQTKKKMYYVIQCEEEKKQTAKAACMNLKEFKIFTVALII